jgi:hypothetical protein
MAVVDGNEATRVFEIRDKLKAILSPREMEL